MPDSVNLIQEDTEESEDEIPDQEEGNPPYKTIVEHDRIIFQRVRDEGQSLEPGSGRKPKLKQTSLDQSESPYSTNSVSETVIETLKTRSLNMISQSSSPRMNFGMKSLVFPGLKSISLVLL